MGFESILGEKKPKKIRPDDIIMPSFFVDLNLDQITQDIMEEQKLYDLRRFYYFKAEDQDEINYRMDVLRELEKEHLRKSVENFALGMRNAREYLGYSMKTDHLVQKQKWKLDAMETYLSSVTRLYEALMKETLSSRGFLLLREWLTGYVSGQDYSNMKDDCSQLMDQFKQLRYSVRIERDKVIIEQEYQEEDYCRELLETFQVKSDMEHVYMQNPFGTNELSALETQILDVLQKLYGEVFQNLKNFDQKYSNFLSEVLNDLEHEVWFYLAFLSYRTKMEQDHYHFCYPILTKEFHIKEAYDLALAKKNAMAQKPVIYNDCYYQEEERFLVITGPNQGGKTTYARALGQILYFASLGLLVPAREARFPVFDIILTHFAVEESINNGAGKLKEELVRLKQMMSKVTERSFVIINEIFTSAASYDSFIMGKRVLDFFMDRRCLGVYVTHIYELTNQDTRIVSMVAALREDNSNVRSFRIVRKPADGISYADTIVSKYQLSYQQVKERLIK
jgi:DNA mismatch repair ATPase MutS